MSDIVTTATPRTVAETMELATHFARSGFFKDASDPSKAIVKMVAGAELGIGPMTAMTGIHIVQGKPVLSAGLVGAMVLRSGRYTYEVVESSDAVCRLAWFRDGRRVGESAFTIDEAKRAGLTGKDTWKNYASDMLFSRALTRGARRFCPDVFLGSVYVADELEGADGPHAHEQPAPTPNGNGVHPDDVIDVTPQAAPEFHATPLVDAMVDPGELPGKNGVMAAIQRGHAGNVFARNHAWVAALSRGAELAFSTADVGIVEDAFDKVKKLLDASQRGRVESAIDAARIVLGEAEAAAAGETIIEGEAVPA